MPQQKYIKHLYEKEDCNIAEISAKVGINWRTAAKYAKKDDWNEPVVKQIRRRPVMEPFTEIVDVWLLEDLLKPRKERRTATGIYHQLRNEHGFTGSERTVRGYVSQRKKELKVQQEEKFLELEHPSGQAQADFGTTHVVWEGELKEIKYLAVSFPFSNAGFCVPVPAENLQCFLHALIQVFEWIGGVPQRIRFDNLSAAVVNIGKGAERELTDTFTRFMLHYRFEAEFCSPAKGNEKGSVENKVGYSRRNWLLPYPQAKSFTELTQILYERAISDLNRIHYAKGVTMAELWQQEQQVLLPLPGIPFEPVELRTARGDKFGKVRHEKEVYHLPSATGQSVLLKLGWDKVEILDQTQLCLGTFPRQYILKAQPIDWKGYFEIFVQKPRGARHAAMYRFLPQAVLSYLEETEHYRERLKFISTLLTEGFAMEDISEALATTRSRSYNPALIRHLLYQLLSDKPLEKLDERHTPVSVKNYVPQITAYDRLMPVKGGMVCD